MSPLIYDEPYIPYIEIFDEPYAAPLPVRLKQNRNLTGTGGNKILVIDEIRPCVVDSTSASRLTTTIPVSRMMRGPRSALRLLSCRTLSFSISRYPPGMMAIG